MKSHSHIFRAVGGVLVSANTDAVLPGPAIQCATRALASGDQFKASRDVANECPIRDALRTLGDEGRGARVGR